MADFEIDIVSLPDRERLVAEICYKGKQWVEISQEHKEVIVQFYSHSNEGYWEFPFRNWAKITATF